MPSILLVDDEEDIRWSLKLILRDEEYQFREASNGREAIEQVRAEIPDVVILDLRMSEMDGLQTMEELLRLEPSLPVLILTGVDSVKTAVHAMKLGASDYVVKPVDHAELRTVVRSILERSTVKREVFTQARTISSPMRFLSGRSESMRSLEAMVRSLAGRDVNVLIQGESGCGKQLVAETLHELSPRCRSPFVTVDCGALPETLMESEFFGHEKGAFTGAFSRKIGKLEAARGGTLFLDEIGNLGLALQAKLLRVLETRQFERVGGTSSIQADFRLLTATNANLRDLVQRGHFRNDLYYRINVFTLEVPALREHKEDLPDLVSHFLDRFNSKHSKQVNAVAEESWNILRSYSWPGNVRQLRNALERAVLLAHDRILPAHLPAEIREQEPAPQELHALPAVPLGEMEAKALRAALERSGGNKTRAARELGISLRTLYYWLKRHNMPSRFGKRGQQEEKGKGEAV